jgi:hypothetical protein
MLPHVAVQAGDVEAVLLLHRHRAYEILVHLLVAFLY